MDLYIRQQLRVLWNNCASLYFTVSNGVKLEGVLSPTLFTMHSARQLKVLRNSGYGCHLTGVYMGVLAYADDVTLISPSRQGLNKALEICNYFALNNYITFNTNKTTCIKIGEPVTKAEKLFLNGDQLKFSDELLLYRKIY